MAQGKCDKTGDSLRRPFEVTTMPRMYGKQPVESVGQ